MRSFLRVFRYNDKTGWALNAVAFLAIVAAGTALPLMNFYFGPWLINAKISQIALNITAIRAIKNLRVEFVRQLLRQEIAFFDAQSVSVASQITANGNLIYHGISEKLGLVLQSLSMLIAAFVVAFVVQWKLTLITVAVMPMNTIIMLICICFDTKYEGQMFAIYNTSGSLAEEALSTIRTAHAFWAFPKLVARFEEILANARRVGDKKSFVYAVLFPVEWFSITVGYALAFWQGMQMYSRGEIKEPGTVVTVISAVIVATQALKPDANRAAAMAAAQEFFSTIDRVSGTDSLSNEGTIIKDFQGSIRLEGVSFSYPSRPNTPVLQNLSLDFPPSQITAIVGASGCGKSTIFGLLERWYAYSSGIITLDGHPLESVNLRWLRTNTRIIQQEPTLFSGSIYQNIADGLASSDAATFSDEEKSHLVMEACKAALIHDFVAQLPKGYETWIGERGASLSGGQKQRLVIARTIISNPKVLLLDEATSALDPSAEKTVQAALNNVAKGRTVIIVAHRLSTVQDSHNIIVLGKGGRSFRPRGAYASLVRAQDLGEKILSSVEEKDCSASGEKGDNCFAVVESESRQVLETRDGKGQGEAGTLVHHGLFQGLFLIMKEQSTLWWHASACFLSCTAGGLMSSSISVLAAKSLEAYERVDVEQANFFALGFFIIALCSLVVYAIVGWCSNVIAQTIVQFYRRDILDNTLRQDMTFFDDPENSTGALVSRLATEPLSLQELLSINVALIVICIVNVLCSCIIAIVYGWKLGLVLSFGALPILIGAGYLRIRLETKFEQDTAERFATSSAIAAEAAMSIRTVCSLALEERVIERYSQSLDGIVRDSIGNLGVKMFFYAMSQSVSLLIMGLGFWYGGRLVSTGEYTLSQFYMVYLAIVFSGQAAAALFQHTTSISKATTAINYVFGLRQTRTLVDNDDDDDDDEDDDEQIDHGHDHNNNHNTNVNAVAKDTQLSSPLEDVENLCLEKVPINGLEACIDQVHFAYALRPKQKVLRGINMSIKPGKMTALVGASGCGKSTLIGLLERFYDPLSGTMWLKNDRRHRHDIKTIHRRILRRDMALVQQEPILYQGSIQDNISLGIEHSSTKSTDPSEAEIKAACQSANIWDFIVSLPDGLRTPCGSQGFALSGGQRQRIALARALIRQPRLLLLDEATSALDTASERVVKAALDQAAEGRTTVAVAHRLSTIRDAHTIFVFVRGVIVEAGSHEELLQRQGVYHDMVLAQSLDREA
ncbi:hypothetical protein E4U09_004665 [Claviceps aff. purpurea]|uniref:Multidrug resistance protein n=1 Tax=Claviceps aff. purpurea TaxID=1967640 RepID=A0A9P7QP27_9HYPO|nr:hypothetical protein E4U09_004665 [Claviceps aff. purpurea]